MSINGQWPISVEAKTISDRSLAGITLTEAYNAYKAINQCKYDLAKEILGESYDHFFQDPGMVMILRGLLKIRVNATYGRQTHKHFI